MRARTHTHTEWLNNYTFQNLEVNPFPTALCGFPFHVQPCLAHIKTLSGSLFVSCGNFYLESAIMLIALDLSGFISLLFICELDKRNISGRKAFLDLRISPEKPFLFPLGWRWKDTVTWWDAFLTLYHDRGSKEQPDSDGLRWVCVCVGRDRKERRKSIQCDGSQWGKQRHEADRDNLRNGILTLF